MDCSGLGGARAGRHRQVGCRQPVMLGGEIAVAHLRRPVMERPRAAGLRDMARDGRQLEPAHLAELQRQRLRLGTLAVVRRRRLAECRDLRRRHHQLVALGRAPGDLVLLQVVLVGQRLGRAHERLTGRPADGHMVGVPGHPIGPKAQDHLRAVHADRLHQAADQLVLVGVGEPLLRVVEHAQHVHTQQRHRAAHLVLANRVQVAPDHGAGVVPIASAGSRRLLDQPRVESAPRGADDHDVRAVRRRPRDGSPEPERLVTRMGDDDHQAAGGLLLADRPPDRGHGRQDTSLDLDLERDGGVVVVPPMGEQGAPPGTGARSTNDASRAVSMARSTSSRDRISLRSSMAISSRR